MKRYLVLGEGIDPNLVKVTQITEKGSEDLPKNEKGLIDTDDDYLDLKLARYNEMYVELLEIEQSKN